MSGNTQWLVYPLDNNTDKTLAGQFGNENMLVDVGCADGEKRTMYGIPREKIGYVLRSKRQMNLKFWLFRREGNYALAVDVTNVIKPYKSCTKPQQKAGNTTS